MPATAAKVRDGSAGDPLSLLGLVLYLDATQVSGQLLAFDNFDRSKNLLTNQSFESGTSGYSAPNGSTLAASSAQVHSGSQSALVTLPAHTGGGFSGIGQTIANFPAGVTVTFSVWVYNPSTGGAPGGVQMSVQGTAMSGAINGPPVTTRDAWVRLTHTVTASALGNLTCYVLGAGTTVAGEFFYTDDWQVELGTVATTLTWGDATHLGSSLSGHAWTVSEGALGITSGAAAATGGVRSVATMDVGTADHEISADLPSGNYSGAPGVHARYVDASNYLSVVCQSDFNTVLYSRVAGVSTARASFGSGSVVNGTPASVKLTVQGSTVVATLNGATRTYTLTAPELAAFGASTKAGVISGNSTALVDNVVVKTPIYGDGATMPVWPDLSGNFRHVAQSVAAKQPLLRTPSPNLLPNDQATAEASVASWASGSGGVPTVSRSTAWSSHGSASVALTTTAAVASYIQTITAPVTLTPGGTYVYTGVLRNAQGAARDLRAYAIGSTGYVVLGQQNLNAVPAGGVVSFSIPFTAPADGKVLIRFDLMNPSAAGEIVQGDDFAIYASPAPPIWVPPAVQNLLSYATATVDPDTSGWAATGVTLARDTAKALQGAASLIATATGATTASAQQAGGRVPVTAGRAYGYTASLSDVTTGAGGAGTTWRTQVDWFNASNAYISSTVGNAVGPGTAWTTSTAVGVAPVGAVAANVYVLRVATTAVTGDSVRIDQVGFFADGLPASGWVPPVVMPAGGACVQFDGADDQMATLSLPKSSDATLFLVVRRETAADDQRALYWRANSGVWLSNSTSVALTANSRNADNSFAGANLSTSLTVWHLQGGIFTSGQAAQVDLDGAVALAGVNYVFDAADPTALISVGGFNGPGLPLNGSVVAVLVFNRALSTAERQQVEAYLRARFGTP